MQEQRVQWTTSTTAPPSNAWSITYDEWARIANLTQQVAEDRNLNADPDEGGS